MTNVTESGTPAIVADLEAAAPDLTRVVPLGSFATDRDVSLSQTVAVIDAFDHSGAPVEGAPIPDDLAPDRKMLANTVLRVDPDVIFVYAGEFWIDDENADGLHLSLMSKVRCTEFAWCVGHQTNPGLELDESHMSKADILHEFPRGNMHEALNEAEVCVEVEPGHEPKFSVGIRFEGLLTRAELADAADQLMQAARALGSYAGPEGF